MRYFSYDLTTIDSLRGQVIGHQADRVFIRAQVPHDTAVTVFGFAFFQATVAIGSTVEVAIVKEFPDGEFRFRIEGLDESSVVPLLRGRRESAFQTIVA